MKLGFIAKAADKTEWASHCLSVSRGDLYLKISDASSVEKIREQLRKIDEMNQVRLSKDCGPVEIDVTLDIHYRDRSPEAARLMFALEGIVVKMLNRELKSAREQWTHEQIHEQGLENHSPRMYVIFPKEHLNLYLEDLKADRSRVISVTDAGDGQARVDYYLSSNKWDAKRMHTYIEALVSDLDSMGVGSGDGVMDILFSDWEAIKQKGASNATLFD